MKNAMLILLLFSSLFSQEYRKFVILQQNWEPYLNSTFSGYWNEYLVEALNWLEIDYQPITYDSYAGAFGQLRIFTGDAQLLFEEDIDSTIYFKSDTLFVVDWYVWGDSTIKAIDESTMRGKRIGIVQGYPYSDEFFQFIQSNCNILLAVNDVELLQLYRDGSVDFIAGEERTIAFRTKLQKIGNEKVGSSSVHLAINNRYIDKELAHALFQTLQEINLSKRGKKMRESWK